MFGFGADRLARAIVAELSSWINMESPNSFEVGANTGGVQVSGGVLHLESVP